VFNEEASVENVIREWIASIAGQVTGFVLLAIDDGSSDRTGEILVRLSDQYGGRMEWVKQANVGHGQTCLRGYAEAAARKIPFVFQIDSDGQCDPQDFPKFWQARHSFDVIYGVRNGREDGLRRVVASKLLQLLLLLRANVWCPDANVPFRLMRIDAVEPMIAVIPSDFCLANIALAVLLRRDSSVRHGSFPIRFHARTGGEPSVPLSNFFHKAVELYHQLERLPR